MPDTYRDWNAVREIAISCTYGGTLVSGHERKIVGDIIACRKPLAGIGMAEAEGHVWLRVTTLDDSDLLDRLTEIVYDDPDNPTVQYEKRRYCIPFDRLAEQVPSFSISRARDTGDLYQPFLGFDEDLGWFHYDMAPLQIEGLVYDKVAENYL